MFAGDQLARGVIICERISQLHSIQESLPLVEHSAFATGWTVARTRLGCALRDEQHPKLAPKRRCVTEGSANKNQMVIMPTPTYTIQQDPVWKPSRASTAPTVSSMYSDDYENAIPGSHALDVPQLQAKDSYHPSYHAHPRQQVNDYGPQVRQSRLPVFKQVRSMLHKPPPLTTPGNPKWDEYTGELSDSGKPSSVKPSNYTSPYDGAFKAYRKRSPEGFTKSKKNLSPVSVLRDEEIEPAEPMEPSPNPNDDTEWSPVSPVSRLTKDTWERDDVSEMIPDMMPEPLSPNVQRAPQPEQSPAAVKQTIVKRKPVSRCVSTAENYPPVPSPQHSPSQSSDLSERMIDDKDLPPAPEFETESESQRNPNSHFSWTTYAPSVAPGRQSIDTVATRNLRYQSGLTAAHEPRSRFSWSTIATNRNHHQAQQDTMPASRPPPVPSKFTSPPVQSILSRRRPVQRMEEKEWAPPPRDASLSSSRSATPKNSNTPTSAHTARPLPLPKDNATPTSARARSPAANTPGSSGKALPPPPTLSADQNLSHLETLLAQERSIILQRRNVEKGILELEKIEKASPLDVSFGAVRDAKRRLGEYRARLAEVKLEERDLGVAIARARRRDEKENGGDGESLWVRRVTG